MIGAGPSGLSAAIAAAEQGLRVVVVDENSRAGGSLNYQFESEPHAQGTLEKLLQKAATLPNLRIQCSMIASGYYADHWIALLDAEKLTKMRAGSVVVASGAVEQPAAFRNNDLPGVMLASAAQRLIRLYAVKPFETAVVLTANADGYRAAADLVNVGIRVAAIVDMRPQGETSSITKLPKLAGIPIKNGHAIYEAIPAGGKIGITGVQVCALDPNGNANAQNAQQSPCDGVVMSVGWAPTDGLLNHVGGKMSYSQPLEQFIPDVLPPGTFAAGRVNGFYALEDRLADGRRAGIAAAVHVGKISSSHAAAIETKKVERNSVSHNHPFPIIDHPQGKVFVDFDEDVQYKDILNAEQEGFDNIELLKRYSTFGMGPSQGKACNTNVIRILAKVLGKTVGEVGAPRSRPFYHPVPLSHLGGRGFHPHRHTPLHSRHKNAGAVFMDAGDWKRPAYYASNGLSRERAIVEEVTAVRQRVGIIDVGTLGKIEIVGPDAAEFVERIYTGRFAKMKLGTTRYGLMCDETGVIIDDGVVARLREDCFYVTTTTTASAAVYREMQRFAIIWGLNVTLVNVTGIFAAMNLAGPESRQLLSAITDVDLSEAAFPYLGLREAKVLGVPVRLMRVGFVGELGYEIHVPANWAARVWDGIFQAGQNKNISVRPFGVEAQRVLRLEKGHAIIGQDTDGLTGPREAAMTWAVKMDKPFFIGQRSLKILEPRPITRQLVGFTLPENDTGPVPKECHLVISNNEITGRVTSITVSPTLKRPIGLAYVNPSQAKPGNTISIRVDGGTMIHATVVELPFYDPKNQRQLPQGVA